MRRILVSTAISLAALACSGSGSNADGSGTMSPNAGGKPSANTGGGASNSVTNATVGGSSNSSSSNSSSNQSTGGTDASRGGSSSAANGGSDASKHNNGGTGGSNNPVQSTSSGRNGRGNAGSGATVGGGVGRANAGSGPVGIVGGGNNGTKPDTRPTAGNGNSPTTPVNRGGAAGGGAKPSTGGAPTAGGPSTLVTTPTVKDPVTAAEGLTKYYISNSGDDKNSGTSPDSPWATVTNVPKDKASAVYFQKGGTFKAAGAPQTGRDGPAAFNPVKGSVWTSYGSGDKRPLLVATEKTSGKVTGAVVQPGGDTLIAGLSFTGQAAFGLLLLSNNNVAQDCEIDGTIEGTQIQLGFSVRGDNNKVVGNYIHSLHEVILDNGSVNTSGGAEAIVVNGTNHEIAYNKIVDCWCENKTLGGAEGGCLEIIARKPGEVVENITFHHNYCERSVGLFEACAGDFAGTGKRIQENHAVVRNTVLAYNVVVDAMWLYLLQTVNTDMDGLTFEHNTLVHSKVNDEIPQQGAPGFGNFYDTDMWVTAAGMTPAPKSCSAAADCDNSFAVCANGQCAYQTKAKPGQISVRNNLFVVLDGAKPATMKLPPGTDDVINNIFSPKAPSGVTASAGHVTVVADPGLVDTFRLAPNSPAIDKAGADSLKPWVDFDGTTVPCGSAPDVGAIEYCPK